MLHAWLQTRFLVYLVPRERQSINQSINQYSFNERHVKTQANTCMTYN